MFSDNCIIFMDRIKLTRKTVLYFVTFFLFIRFTFYFHYFILISSHNWIFLYKKDQIKSKVYGRKVNTLDELLARIMDSIARIKKHYDADE